MALRSNQKLVRLSGKKITVGCKATPHCDCKCRPCAAGTIVLITANVSLETTISDLQGDPIPNGRIVRIQPEHQLRFISPQKADELKRILEETEE
jgi:hypothetical protein